MHVQYYVLFVVLSLLRVPVFSILNSLNFSLLFVRSFDPNQSNVNWVNFKTTQLVILLYLNVKGGGNPQIMKAGEIKLE